MCVLNFRRALNYLILDLIKKIEEVSKITDSDNLLHLCHASCWCVLPTIIELLICSCNIALDSLNVFGGTPEDFYKSAVQTNT